MKKVTRQDLLDYQTYNDTRDVYRAQVLSEKEQRRIHLGSHLTFLFETTNTIRYQIQEMMRLERMARESDIQHELTTYNELLGDSGELGCTLLIEIDDEKQRNVLLRAWLGLPEKIYLKLEDGSKARAKWDQAQVGDDRLSAVQYLKFSTGKRRVMAVGCEHPELTLEAPLTEAQRLALLQDAS